MQSVSAQYYMKNIITVFISTLFFGVLALAHILISLHYWSEEKSAIDSYLANIVQPLLIVIAGYICVKISNVKKWWFAGFFAITTYILLTVYLIFLGPGIDFSTWGLAAMKVPAALAVFSLLGGGIYQYYSTKH
jgi:hypothetical protein